MWMGGLKVITEVMDIDSRYLLYPTSALRDCQARPTPAQIGRSINLVTEPAARRPRPRRHYGKVVAVGLFKLRRDSASKAVFRK
jgi:hypothetical protein